MSKDNEITNQIKTFIIAMSRAESTRDLMQIEAEATSFLLGLAMGARSLARDCDLYKDFLNYVRGLDELVEKTAAIYGDRLADAEEKNFFDRGGWLDAVD